MDQHRLTQSEIQLLQKALSAGYIAGNIRLREGEYQYDLVKTIASFQLEPRFPDVKDIVKRLYGEEKTRDLQFIRKIQTILKKMEKSNVVTILPKTKPWELQRYALSSFKFQDSDKSLVILATDQQTNQLQNLLNSILSQQEISKAKLSTIKTKSYILGSVVVASYAATVWALMQPIVNLLIFVPSFSVAAACSLMLGKMLSQE